MVSNRLKNSIDVLTSIAIVVGLGLVIWELRQNHEATMSTLSSAGYEINVQTDVALLGEQAADVLAKACDSPGELSRRELIVLHAYYRHIALRLQRVKDLADRGSFYDSTGWEGYVEIWLSQILATIPGQAYWRTIGWPDPEVQAAGNDLLERLDTASCKSNYDAWQNLIGELVDRR